MVQLHYKDNAQSREVISRRERLAGWAAANEERFSLLQPSISKQIPSVNATDIALQCLVPVFPYGSGAGMIEVLTNYSCQSRLRQSKVKPHRSRKQGNDLPTLCV